MEEDIVLQLTEGLSRLVQNERYFVDPIFKIIDPRPVAEFAKSLLYRDEQKRAEQLFDWLVTIQNKDGSWNEVLNREFSEASCVATPIVGRMLLIAYQRIKKRSYLSAAMKALMYIEKQEFLPGYFIKSYCHYSDVLNVNATCAAFLQKAYEIQNEKKWLDMRDRAIFNVVRYQFKDGAYPYAARMHTFPYEHHLNVRDPHYHVLTLYFLLLADPKLSNRYFAISFKKAIKWMENEFKLGMVNWSHDEHMFSVGVTGAYGYALFCSIYGKDKMLSNKLIDHLSSMQRADGLFNRFEKGTLFETVRGLFRELLEVEHICPKEFCISTRILRCKRRIGRDVKDRRNLKISLYYSTQILDCLTEKLLVECAVK